VSAKAEDLLDVPIWGAKAIARELNLFTEEKDKKTIAEEQIGCEPARDNHRGIGRDDFGMLYGMVPTIERLQPRRKPTANQLAQDEAAAKGFHERFPMAARIRGAI
jgi:hypothetical protein